VGVRVNRDELVEFQVDGTQGSAVAGLFGCKVQHAWRTPQAGVEPRLPTTERFREQWLEVPDNGEFDNGFKLQWEQFVRHVVEDAPHPYDFLPARGARSLAEAGLRSSREGRRIELDGSS
jgi:predicted dehydrogenase